MAQPIDAQEIAIDLLINGLDKLDKLNAGLRELRQAAAGVERSSTMLDRLSESTSRVSRSADASAAAQIKAADAALRQEQALARLQMAQGNTAQAVKTLQNALAGFEGSQIQAIRAQIQLTNYQNNYANSALISAVRNQQLGASFQSLLTLLGPVGAGIGQIVGLLDQIASAGRLFGGTGREIAQTAKEAGDLAKEFDTAAQASLRLSRAGAEFRAPRPGSGAAATEEADANQRTAATLVRNAQLLSSLEEGLKNDEQKIQQTIKEREAELAKLKKALEEATAALAQFQKEKPARLAEVPKSNSEDTAFFRQTTEVQAAAIRNAIEAEEQKAVARIARLKGEIQTLEGLIAGGKKALDEKKKDFAQTVQFLKDETGSLNIADFQKNLGASVAGLRAALSSLRADFSGVGDVAEQAGAVVGVVFGTTVVASLAAALAGGVAFAGLLRSIGQQGIVTNAELEKLNLGIASVLAGTGKISLDGAALEGAEKFTGALQVATEQVRQLRQEARSLGLPVQETVEGFQATLGPLTQFGLTLDQSRQTTLKIVLAMQALGIPLREIGQETRALLNGETSRQDRLNRILQVTKQELETAKQRGEVQQLLNQRLEGFAAGGEAFARSFEGASQRIRALFQTFSTDATSGLFDKVRDGFNSVLDQVASRGGFDKVFSGLTETFQKIFDGIGEIASQAINSIFNAFVDLSDMLSKNQDGVQGLILGFDLLIDRTVSLGKTFVDVFGITGGGALNFFAQLLQGIAVAIAATQDTVELFWASFAGGLKIVVGLIEGALYTALSLVGIQVRGLSDDLKRLSGDLSTLFGRIDQGFKNAAEAEDRIIKQQASGLLNLDNSRGGPSRLPSRGLTFTPNPAPDKPGKSSARSSDAQTALNEALRIAESEFRIRLALAQREIALAQAAEQTQTVQLREALEDRRISIAGYYDAVAALQQKAATAQAAALELEIDNTRREIQRVADEAAAASAKLARDRARALGAAKPEARAGVGQQFDRAAAAIETKRITETNNLKAKEIELNTRLQVQREKAVADEAKLARERAQAFAKLSAEYSRISVAIQGSIGAGFEAEVDKRLGKIQEQIRAIDAEAQAQIEEKQALVARGLLSELQARLLILEIEKKASAEVKAQLDAAARLIQVLPDSEKKRQLAAENRLNQTQNANRAITPEEQRTADLRKGLTSDIRSAFEEFLANGKLSLADLGQFALGVVNGVRRALARIIGDFVEKRIIQPAVDFFLGKILGLKVQIDPATVANTAAVTANTAAVTALTAAILAKAGADVASAINEFGQPADVGSLLGDEGLGEQATSPVQSILGRLGGAIKGFGEKIGGVVGKIGGGLGSIAGAILGFVGRIFGAVLGGAANPAASGELMAGFDEGGYTGDGPTTQPAGIVHAGEHVQPASVVRRWGAGFFEAIRTGAISPADITMRVNRRVLSAVAPRNPAFGFTSGGLVGSASGGAVGGHGEVSINNVIVDDRRNMLAALTTPEGVRTVLTMLGRHRAAVNAQLQGA